MRILVNKSSVLALLEISKQVTKSLFKDGHFSSSASESRRHPGSRPFHHDHHHDHPHSHQTGHHHSHHHGRHHSRHASCQDHRHNLHLLHPCRPCPCLFLLCRGPRNHHDRCIHPHDHHQSLPHRLRNLRDARRQNHLFHGPLLRQNHLCLGPCTPRVHGLPLGLQHPLVEQCQP